MKKLFTLIAVLVASVTVANAQIGIIGGVTSNTTNINTDDFMENLKGINLYHVGVVAKIPLPIGFAIQPELLYQMKGADLAQTVETVSETGDPSQVSTEFDTKTGFAELNLGLQWGLDLAVIRPFVFAKPFVGYQLTSDDEFDAGEVLKEGTDAAFEKYMAKAKEKLEYGFSFGAGIELLEHFQVSFEYYKNLGKMFNEGEFDTDAAMGKIAEGYADLDTYGGFKVSLAFLF